MSSPSSWCTIESDPAVFAELINQLGVVGLDVEELYDLDPGSLGSLGRIYGLIFLFKWEPSSSEAHSFAKPDFPCFFARQIVQNACATQAILSILLNLPPSVPVGSLLADFKQFTADFDPELKGMAIGEHEAIRQIHNGFARPEAMYIDEEATGKRRDRPTEDPFHFISILPVNGDLLEFDGLKEAPVILTSSIADQDWIRAALENLQSRIASVPSNEIRFNLMAVIQDRTLPIREQLEALDADNEWQRADLQVMLAELDQRKEARRRDNQLRRHNFVPLVMAILNLMVSKGRL